MSSPSLSCGTDFHSHFSNPMYFPSSNTKKDQKESVTHLLTPTLATKFNQIIPPLTFYFFPPLIFLFFLLSCTVLPYLILRTPPKKKKNCKNTTPISGPPTHSSGSPTKPSNNSLRVFVHVWCFFSLFFSCGFRFLSLVTFFRLLMRLRTHVGLMVGGDFGAVKKSTMRGEGNSNAAKVTVTDWPILSVTEHSKPPAMAVDKPPKDV